MIPTVYYGAAGLVQAISVGMMPGWYARSFLQIAELTPPSGSNFTYDRPYLLLQTLPWILRLAFRNNKPIKQVLGDFLHHSLDCSRKYIEEKHSNGPKLWETLAPEAEHVLSYPKGWVGSQQSQMRLAAVASGLVGNAATVWSAYLS